MSVRQHRHKMGISILLGNTFRTPASILTELRVVKSWAALVAQERLGKGRAGGGRKRREGRRSDMAGSQEQAAFCNGVDFHFSMAPVRVFVEALPT